MYIDFSSLYINFNYINMKTKIYSMICFKTLILNPILQIQP
jgi:hypothetical protein